MFSKVFNHHDGHIGQKLGLGSVGKSRWKNYLLKGVGRANYEHTFSPCGNTVQGDAYNFSAIES